MNRNIKEKDKLYKNELENVKYIEPIPPKFAVNWSQNIRFDKIFINISDCEYDIVPKVAKELKWKVKRDQNCSEWDIWWTDWAVSPQTLMKMQHHQKINHFPGMFNLSRKNLLAKNLMRMRKRSPEQYQFFPLTWNLPLEYNEFRQYYETKPKGKTRTYIVKPESLSQGKGIFLTKKIQHVDPEQRCVIQRYISKPYLIDELKFDLRVYVLVAGVDPLKVFMYQEGLARFATEHYVVPNKDNIEDICMHLTNYAINKESDKFVFNNDKNNMSIGHKRSITAVLKLMEEKGVNTQVLLAKIHQLIVKTLISGLSHLKFQYRSCQLQNYRSDMCFQILGFDVILNEDLQPFLLEINYTPSFTTDTPLDETIKKNLIKDTLNLMEINKKFKQKTVNQRKEYRKNRMMTGKSMKISPEERQDRRKLAQKDRDKYISRNLGRFTQIYPLKDEDCQQNRFMMKKYQELINLADDPIELTGKKNQKQAEKTIDNHNKKMQKSTKLPILNSIREEDEKKNHKAKTSEIITHNIKDTFFFHEGKSLLNSTSLKQESSHEEAKSDSNPNDVSKNLIKKLKFKEIAMNRKRAQPREALLLKAIQFQGNQFDGLCDNFKHNVMRKDKNQ